jgi:PPOX class probable F420-dependent enzyme
VDVDAFLRGRRIAALATENEDGSIHLSAVWYLYEAGSFYVATAPDARKARNVRARPRASIMIDSRGRALRGVASAGAADLLHGEDARAINERLWRRYLTEAGRAHSDLGVAIAEHDVTTIRIRPGPLRSWDVAADFESVQETPGLVHALDD